MLTSFVSTLIQSIDSTNHIIRIVIGDVRLYGIDYNISQRNKTDLSFLKSTMPTEIHANDSL